MPPSSTPIDPDCLIKILRGHRLQIRVDPGRPEFAFLVQGDELPWPIPMDRELSAVEIRALFQVAGLEIGRLQLYRLRFRGGAARQQTPKVN